MADPIRKRLEKACFVFRVYDIVFGSKATSKLLLKQLKCNFNTEMVSIHTTVSVPYQN